MEKRKLEKLGIEVSLLGFGCMRFPMTDNGEINEAEAEAMLDRAIAGGVNYMDTAYVYHGGKSESFVGKALQKYDRASYYLATKLPVWNCNTIEDVERIFKEQLQRLRTEYIDFYLLHSLGKKSWSKVLEIGAIQFLESMKKEGKIKYLGFSFHDEYQVFEEILCYRDWDFCQIQLNYMDTEEQAGMKGAILTKEKDIPLIIMEPVKGGALASFSEDILEKFRESSDGLVVSPASYALRWIGSLPNIKCVLSGMSTMEQVEDNLKTYSPLYPLTTKEQAAIEEVTEILAKRVKNGCTGCRYCMPCPVGVNIPASFGVWNTYHMYQNYFSVNWRWENEIGEKAHPNLCIQCGKCEEVCPQKLNIREDLKKVGEDLEKKIY